jgi:hypothetical protein
MDDANQLLPERFGVYYNLVKALAIYAGVFILCYFWPLLIEFVVSPPSSQQMRFVASAALAPLGFLFLGARGGIRSFLLHAILLGFCFVDAYLYAPKGMTNQPLDSMGLIWTPMMGFVYAFGAVWTGLMVKPKDSQRN